ncbi:glycosyltransferase [Xenophilus sp.]|uniref:glycosyltransferase n=1 Tax=Xenophilus sp. TaxID=1873499 RepID=UPI0037DD8FD1
MTAESSKRGLLVLASTYPRWYGDHEPGFVHELSRRLSAAFDVTVVTPHAQGALERETMDGVEIVRYRYAPERLETLVHGGGMAANLARARWKWLLLPGFLFAQYLAARRVLSQRPIAVVHVHWLLPQGLVALLAAGRRGVPYVVTSHGGDLFGLRGRVATRLKRLVAKRASAMTVVSSAMREEAGRLGLAPPAIDVVPMGADLRARFVASDPAERDADTLLFVGRLVPKKGLVHLLDAMPLILAARPGVVLEIAGFGPDRPALEAHAAALGIAAHVRFLGAMPQAELPSLYGRAGVFVAPFVRDASGDQEGLPVALMEAIGCGCPAVVGDVAGVHDLLGDEARQVVVDPRDREALARAVLEVLEHPAEARARTLALRARAIERVDWDRIAARYAEILNAAAVT